MTVQYGNIEDYVGRTADLAAFQGQKLKGDATVEQALVTADSPGGTLVTGVVKLAQRWLLEFLTDFGSMPLLPLRGCEFTGRLRRGELHTALDVESAFFLSAQQVEESLVGEEDPDTEPNDERYGSVDLESLAISGDTVTLHIRLTPAEGDPLKLILPVPVRIG